MQPATFSVDPSHFVLNVAFPKPRALQLKPGDRETLKMKATQLPIISNNATTGHKLQGSSVKCLFVHQWSNVKNWNYVMLSRVRTRKGLFCRDKITRKKMLYKVPVSLTRMLNKFREKAPDIWSEEDYEEMFGV